MKITAIARAIGWHSWQMINRRHDETLTRPAAVQEIAELLLQRRQDLLRQIKLLEEAEAELDRLAAFN
jgi:hypothetical protein